MPRVSLPRRRARALLGPLTGLCLATVHAASPIDRPVSGLDLERRLDFRVGEALFQRIWVTAPASTEAADGLGPLYNARACSACHVGNGRSRPDGQGLVMRLSVPPLEPSEGDPRPVIPEPTYGTQLQTFAIPGQPAEGRLEIDYHDYPVELGDGGVATLRLPDYRVVDTGYGPLADDTLFSPRLAPATYGLGLLEAIPESEILAAVDPADRDRDGVSGRAAVVWSRAEAREMLGRFGWKAVHATVDDQNQSAAHTDLGLSTPLYPAAYGDCRARQEACLDAPSGDSPQYDNLEAPAQVTALLRDYVRHLAPPPPRDRDDPQVRRGATRFAEYGCATCHRPEWRTGEVTGAPALSQRRIAPYTDLLLHDMGGALADHRPEGDAGGNEWRTPPLWGIGLAERINGNRYFLHDGRARTLLEAVLWHGGEALASREAVRLADADARADLIRFLESL